jgi:hypothetical protein
MTIYTFLFVDATERISFSKKIDCSTDEQAIDLAAQEIGNHRAIQIWDGNRSVALVGKSAPG